MKDETSIFGAKPERLDRLVFEALRFELQTRNPFRAQEALLLDVINKNKDTLYGRKYGFSSIDSIEDFQNKVPLNDYESLKPYIKKMLRGE